MIELYLDYVRQAMEDNQAPEDQEGQDHAIQDQVRQALQDNQVLDLGVTSIGSSDPRDPKTSWSRLKVENFKQQEAQLSQRDRATLCVIEFFAKSLKVTQDHSK